MSDLDDVVSCCRDLLINFSEAKDVANYADARLSKEGQQIFSFGYFPSNEHLQVLVSAVGEERLSGLQLLHDNVSYNYKERHSSMENHNLVMPYRDVYGNIIAIVGRSILGDDERREMHISKYKNTSFAKGSHLFGLYEAKLSIVKNNLVYVVEGQFDCIAAQCKGIGNIVALGSSNMTFEQFALLYRYTNNVILLLDNDDAGNSGADKIVVSYGKYANIKKAALPKGYKDLDDLLIDNSIDAFNYVIR